MSEEKDLYTILFKKEEPKPEEKPSVEEKPQTFEKPPEEKIEEKQKYPKLPNAKNPKHFRG